MKFSIFKVSLLMLFLGFGVKSNESFAQNLNPTVNGNTYTFDFTDPSLYSNPTEDIGYNFPLITDPTIRMGQENSFYSLDTQLEVLADIHKCIPLAVNLQSFFQGLGTNYNPPSITTCGGIENVQGAVDLTIDTPAVTDLTLNVAIPNQNSYTYQVGNQTYSAANSVALNIGLGGRPNSTLVTSCTSSVGQVSPVPTGFSSQGLYAEVVEIDPTTANFNTNSLVVNIHCQTPIQTVFEYGSGSVVPGYQNDPMQFAFITKAIIGASAPQLQLAATALDANDKPSGSPTLSSVASGSTVTLALGGLTSFQLQDSNGNSLPATYQLNGGPTFDPDAPAVDTTNGLYLNEIALLFTSNTNLPLITQELMPVHLGSQQLTITPSNSQYPPT